MRRVILAGTVATSLLTGAAAGLILGVPITAHSGERLVSTTPKVSIAAAASAAAAAAVPATAAPVQTGVAAATSTPAALPAIAPAIAPAAASIVHAKVPTPTSVNTKMAANADTAGTGGELAVVASALHMALSDLKAALAQGESLAQIATSAGIDPAKLIATVVDDATRKINAAVTLGKLARAQADKIMAMLPSLVTDVVNHAFSDIGEGFGAGSKVPVSLGSLGDLASLGNFANLGDLENLKNVSDLSKLANMGSMGNMSNLPKLGDMGSAGNFSSFFSNMFGSFGHFGNVAAGAGSQVGTGATVDPQTLISNLVSMATAAVNAALSSGLLTQAQANTILQSLTPTITELVHKLLDASRNLENQAADWASFASSWMGHNH